MQHETRKRRTVCYRDHGHSWRFFGNIICIMEITSKIAIINDPVIGCEFLFQISVNIDQSLGSNIKTHEPREIQFYIFIILLISKRFHHLWYSEQERGELLYASFVWFTRTLLENFAASRKSKISVRTVIAAGWNPMGVCGAHHVHLVFRVPATFRKILFSLISILLVRWGVL